MKRLSSLVWVAAALLYAGVARAQDFKFGLEGCPGRITGQPGSTQSFDVFCTLTTTKATGTDGAQGWSLSLAVGGGTVSAVTVKGVHVDTRFDDDGDDPEEDGKNADGDPATPIVEHYDLDLQSAGFKVAQKATDPLNPTVTGVVSAVVLHQTQKMVLQPSGTVRILKVTVQATIPEDGCADVTIKYVDGLKGQGQPVKNVVTFGGASVPPSLDGCTVPACAIGPEFNLAMAAPDGAPAASGDTLIEKVVAPDSPNLVEVNVVLTTANLQGKDGPQGWSLSISHDGCMTVDSVTVKGVHVNARYDDDGDDPEEDGKDADGNPATPILENYDLDLQNAGFKVAQKGVGFPPLPTTAAGVVSAIVLHQTQKMVLHSNASDRILKVVYSLPAVQAGQTMTCHAGFLDGLKGQGQPVKNVITLAGASKSPTSSQGVTIKLTGRVTPPKDSFVRGDPNNDGKADIADAIWIVYDIVPGLNGPHAACRDTLDANADGKADLIDAVFIIDWQFRGGPGPQQPYPGCGTTNSSSDASCPDGSTGCPAASA